MTAVPPAMPTSAPVIPAVLANVTSISTTPSPLTPYRHDAGRRPAVLALVANHLEDVALPVAHEPGDAIACGTARAGQGRIGHEQLLPPGQAAPLSGGGAGGQLGPVGRSAPPPRSAAPRRGFSALAGSPLTKAVKRSRRRDTVDSTWRKNSPVPTNSCQRASTSPRRQRAIDHAGANLLMGLVVGLVSDRDECVDRARLVSRARGPGRRPGYRGSRVPRAGLWRTTSARAAASPASVVSQLSRGPPPRHEATAPRADRSRSR